jgi:hypothetical protein
MVEGGKQGGVAASHLAALALQPVLLAADSILKVNGGCVLAIRVADASDRRRRVHARFSRGHCRCLSRLQSEPERSAARATRPKRIAALLGATVPCELPSDFPMNLTTRSPGCNLPVRDCTTVLVGRPAALSDMELSVWVSPLATMRKSEGPSS